MANGWTYSPVGITKLDGATFMISQILGIKSGQWFSQTFLFESYFYFLTMQGQKLILKTKALTHWYFALGSIKQVCQKIILDTVHLLPFHLKQSLYFISAHSRPAAQKLSGIFLCLPPTCNRALELQTYTTPVSSRVGRLNLGLPTCSAGSLCTEAISKPMNLF